MRRMLAPVLLAAAAAAAAGWLFRAELARHLRLPALAGSPHEQYAATILGRDLDETSLGRAWLDVAAAAVHAAEEVRVPFEREGTFDRSAAAAWRFAARRGQRIVVDASFPAGRLFLDLLECDDDGCRPVASSAGHAQFLVHEVETDRTLTLRVQPELLRSGPYAITQRAEATLEFPVAGVSPASIQSAFGAERDRGARSHEGIDIFARRGTPAIAAADGIITGSTTNRLGGNVVWLWSPSRGLALYYAHLERQAVDPGDRVSAGDTVGWVGNTGNARSTAPHLHFGIYARPGGAVDPLPYVCDAPCSRTARAITRR